MKTELSPLSAAVSRPAWRRAAICRADLLQAAAWEPAMLWFELSAQNLDHSLGPTGYLRRADVNVQDSLPPSQGGRSDFVAGDLEPGHSEALQARHLWAETLHESGQAAEDGQRQSQPVPESLPERPLGAQALAAAKQARARSIAPWPRLKLKVEQALLAGQPVSQRTAVDWPQVVKRVARAQTIFPLPRQRPRPWPASITLALDRDAAELTPVVGAMDDLANRLQRLLGVRRVQVRVLAADPRQPARAWRGPEGAGNQTACPWRPMFGGCLVVVTDFAYYGSSMRRDQFDAWARKLLQGSTRLLVLLPLCASHWPNLPSSTQALRWTQRPELVRQSNSSEQRGKHDATPNGLAELLALLALVGRASDGLLRALRCLLPHESGSDAGLELAVWNHPHTSPALRAQHFTSLLPQHLDEHAQRLRYLPTQLVERAEGMRRLWWASMPWADEHLAILRSAQLAPQLLASKDAKAFAARWMAALAYIEHTLPTEWSKALPSQRMAIEVQIAVSIAICPPQVRREHDQSFARLHKIAFTEAQSKGRYVPWYPELEQALERELDGSDPSEPLQLQVLQRGLGLELRVLSDLKNVRKACTPISKTFKANRLRIIEDTGVSYVLNRVQLAEGYRWAPEGSSLHLISRESRLIISKVERPTWAQSWWRDRENGISVSVAAPWGGNLDISHDSKFETELERKTNNGGIHSGKLGTDEVGAFLDLTLRTGIFETIQRFRYIRPGYLWVDRTKNERAWFSNLENRTHLQNDFIGYRKLLVEGFWLADTACTQAMWSEVMGIKHPDFKSDAQLPVGNLNWSEVKTFLKRLSSHLPEGVEAAIPTDVQWGYACRAGQQLPLGEIDTYTIPNVRIIESLKLGVNDAQATKIMGVKHHDANAWGLFQMFGNIWERYEVAIDPSSDNNESMLETPGRSGSWNYLSDHSKLARSKPLIEGQPADNIGFRIILRPMDPFRPSSIRDAIGVRRLFVGNVPHRIEGEEFRALFEEICPVLDFFWPIDRETGRKKSFVFVDVASSDMAEVVEAMNGKDVMGRQLAVNEAVPREERENR